VWNSNINIIININSNMKILMKNNINVWNNVLIIILIDIIVLIY